MSLILVCLLLPLEQASCHCQGQTLSQYFFFFVRSQDTFIQHCVRPTSTPTTPAVPSLSIPFLFPTFVCYSLPWHCPLISFPATAVGAGTRTKKHAIATTVYWNCIIWFLLFYPDLSLLCPVKLLILSQLINHLKSTCLHKHISHLTAAEQKFP